MAYLTAALASDDEVRLVGDEATWRQVEDATVREELHYAFVARAAQLLVAAGDREAATNLVADYILEKQTLGIADYEIKGRDLLREVVVQ